jgi:hypothetical protein
LTSRTGLSLLFLAVVLVYVLASMILPFLPVWATCAATIAILAVFALAYV